MRVRDVGEPGSPTIVHFHGTPSSRLELVSLDAAVEAAGVRLVAFDRPGYGGSSPARFDFASVVADTLAVADELGIDRFATCGQSGGGPFALACAALALGRVTRVGVASGAGPFGLVPGALAALDETDTAARALLPDDPEGAAAGFAAGFAPLATLFGTATDDEVAAGFGEAMSARDTVLLAEPALRRAFVADMREALRGGTSGGGWDNVAWVGDWSFPLDAVRCPVHLWYGDEDRFAPLAHGEWLAANLPDSHLTVRPGEGHLGIYEHIDDVLAALTR